MKSVSYLLASILLAGSPLLAQEAVQAAPVTALAQKVEQAQSKETYQLGAAVIQKVRADYKAGSYTQFLKEMDRDYQNAKKSNGLEGLIEIRKETAQVQIHPEFATSFRKIQEVKNDELLSTVKEAGDSVFVQKVKSAAASVPAVEENLLSVYGKVPGSGNNSDENKLIDIDLEYYYKGIHLDTLKQDDKREKHMALEMEKTDRMLAASQTFDDKALRTAVEKLAADLDERLARNFDMMDLHLLARGKVSPKSSLEDKVSAVISRAQSELSDLHRHLLDTIDENGQSVQI